MLKLKFSLTLVACLVSCAAWAADKPSWAADQAFIGVWKLNPAKSQLADQMKVASVGANRYAFDFGAGDETVTADGTDQPGYGGTTLAVTLTGPNTLRVVRKKDGHKQLTAYWTLSQDGRSLSDDFTSYGPDGTASNVKYVYARTTPTTGFAGTWESSSEKVNFELTLKITPYDDGDLGLISSLSDKPKNLSFDGKDYPNESSSVPPGTTYSSRQVGEHRFEVTDKFAGKIVDTQQLALSSDLKTLTLTIRKPGMGAPNVLVFDRQ